MSEELKTAGTTTIGRPAETPAEHLIQRFGKMGGVLHLFANGNDASPIQRTDHVRSVKPVGNSAITPRDLENNDDVQPMLLLLSESVASRMRELASHCTIAGVCVRDVEFLSFAR